MHTWLTFNWHQQLASVLAAVPSAFTCMAGPNVRLSLLDSTPPPSPWPEHPRLNFLLAETAACSGWCLITFSESWLWRHSGLSTAIYLSVCPCLSESVCVREWGSKGEAGEKKPVLWTISNYLASDQGRYPAWSHDAGCHWKVILIFPIRALR